MTTIGSYLQQATTQLTRAGVATGRLDALVLMEDVLNKDRAWLLAHLDSKISSAAISRLNNLLSRRSQHEPLAYIRGQSEFYGRSFVITPAVLEPRPESETMIYLLKSLVQNHPQGVDQANVLRVADVGTGSGSLGITTALELPNCEVELIDVDLKALKIAKTNVEKFTLNISIIKSNLLKATPQNYDILLCNLPYVPDNFQINLAATHEPKVAIFGGPDGLAVYRQLFQQISRLSLKPLFILTEALPPQHMELQTVAAKAQYHLWQEEDFIQAFVYKDR